MQNQVVLIIDSRKELSIKYKKIIEQNCMVSVFISLNSEEVFTLINDIEPDLIILSDSIGDNVNDLCKQIRIATRSARPVIITLSKSNYVEDKLSSLNAGADDFLSEPIDQSEFCARIHAHLRRHFENSSDPLTTLPLTNTVYKVLRRTIQIKKTWTLMLIDIDNFDSYSEIYGNLASNKMLQAFSAILKSAVDRNDFLGQLDESNFVIITSNFKSNKIALFLNYAFDTISGKFYNEQDNKRGYLLMNGDQIAGRRTPLASTSIGVISNEYKNYNNYREAINAVKEMHKKAKFQPGSSCVIDRPKLCTNMNNTEKTLSKKIIIVENDAALAYLLTTTLDMQNYQTQAINGYNEIIEQISQYKPNLIILDTDNENLEKVLEICSYLKSDINLCRIKVIISTAVHNKEKILSAGADLYLPKPYELVNLFSWINKLIA